MTPSINEVANNLAALQNELGTLRTQITQSEQEANHRFRGHDRHLTQVRRTFTPVFERLRNLESTVNGFVERFGVITEPNDPRVDAILRDFGDMRTRIDSFYQELETRLHALEGRVNDQGDTLIIHGEEIARSHDRLDEVECAPMLGIDPETTHVDVTGSARIVTRWVPAVIVGVIIAFLTNWVLRANVEEWSNWKIFWFSLILGASVTCFIAAIERVELNLRSTLNWGRRQAQETQAETHTVIQGAPQGPPTAVTPVVQQQEATA